MPKDLFCKSFFIIQCITKNIINAIILVDISTTRYGFINEKFAEIIYQMLKIEPLCLTKPKPI